MLHQTSHSKLSAQEMKMLRLGKQIVVQLVYNNLSSSTYLLALINWLRVQCIQKISHNFVYVGFLYKLVFTWLSWVGIFAYLLATHRICLVLATVQFMTVVENVLICGVEAGFYTVLHYLAGSRRTLKLLNLHRDNKKSQDTDHK